VHGVIETRESGGGVSGSDFDEAFADLFAAGYRTAFRLLGSREDAAECAQESCARAFADWAKLADRGDVVPWVVRVSGNLAIDRWRKSRRTPRWSTTPHLGTPIPDRIDLHRALDRLSARQREVVILRFLADLPEVTVAELLGCSLSSVKTHARRGLAALRAVLDVEEETEA
jgi:DNA-directed RNA polymerase specialized sigma24 family protein